YYRVTGGEVYFVGAVNCQVYLRVLFEGGEGDAQLAGHAGCSVGGGNTHDVEAGGYSRGQAAHRVLGGRAGAQADHHAVRDVLYGPLGGGSLELISLLGRVHFGFWIL